MLGVLNIEKRRSWLFIPVTSLTLFLSGQVLSNDCFPTMDSKKKQYLVGYGSFLYDEARKNQWNENKLIMPVWLQGYKRGWFTRPLQAEYQKMTRLGVAKSQEDRLNAVLVYSKPGEIKSYDEKQKLLCRSRVEYTQLSSMNNTAIPRDGEFWVYETKKKQQAAPTVNYSIRMSEVDEFLTGCIDQGEMFRIKDFSEQCVKTTVNWSENWDNDRDRPLGGKLVQTRRTEVNQLLERTLGALFEKKKAE